MAAVNKLKPLRLFGHGRADFLNAVTDKIDDRRCREIKVAVVVGVPDVDSLASCGNRKTFAKGASQNR